jgi:hypothetical protein
MRYLYPIKPVNSGVVLVLVQVVFSRIRFRARLFCNKAPWVSDKLILLLESV